MSNTWWVDMEINVHVKLGLTSDQKNTENTDNFYWFYLVYADCTVDWKTNVYSIFIVELIRLSFIVYDKRMIQKHLYLTCVG